jgi:hypothetical protein
VLVEAGQIVHLRRQQESRPARFGRPLASPSHFTGFERGGAAVVETGHLVGAQRFAQGEKGFRRRVAVDASRLFEECGAFEFLGLPVSDSAG